MTTRTSTGTCHGLSGRGSTTRYGRRGTRRATPSSRRSRRSSKSSPMTRYTRRKRPLQVKKTLPIVGATPLHPFPPLPSPTPHRSRRPPAQRPRNRPILPISLRQVGSFPAVAPPSPVVRLPSPFLPPSAMALASSREISPLPPSHTSHPAPPPPAAVPRSCRHPLSPLLPLQPASPSPATANTPSPPSPSTHKKGCKARPPYPLRCAHTRRLAPLLPSLAQRQDLPRSSREDTKTTPR